MLKRYINEVIKRLLLKQNYVWNRPMLYLERDRRFKVFPGSEYIRTSSLELVTNEIYERGVQGAVAELGVFQGEFAKLINKAFPDRKLYLMDTFTGFDERDTKIEKAEQFSTGDQDFSDTSIEKVMQKMTFKENCIIKKGFFPESIGDLEEEFAFVSIDVDLYKPTIDGLNYFYQRLNPGGFIFIHDYNNDQYKGIKRAVREFANEKKIVYFPLTDRCGSVVIAR